MRKTPHCFSNMAKDVYPESDISEESDGLKLSTVLQNDYLEILKSAKSMKVKVVTKCKNIILGWVLLL